MAEAFYNHMRFKTLGLKWYEASEIMNAVFPANEALSKDDVLMIDVGGSTGKDILGFHEAHESMTGRLILQDLPATIGSLDSEAMVKQGVQAMAYDFFTPQPVKGAKAYYLKQVRDLFRADQATPWIIYTNLSSLGPARLAHSTM